MSTTRRLLQSLAATGALVTGPIITYASYTKLQADIAQNPNVRYEYLPHGKYTGSYFKRISPATAQQATEHQARSPQDTSNQTAQPYRSFMRRP
ncbi:MAG: hypothetical protein A3F43_06525 [Gammaproteobacteria bacterium RIFCSPHIGHO2_12_FULL_42_10]|nr:MAG: hypothetical protein A3F43_06525 [Gammaproteobacteria bacterium RIFCSPHIGHO2_12_FULL_42_10]